MKRVTILRIIPLFIFYFFSINNSYSQLRLLLLDVKHHRFHEIKSDQKEKFGIRGYNAIHKLKLIALKDSGGIFEGRFWENGKRVLVQKYIPISDIKSIRKISGGHTVIRVIGGFFMVGVLGMYGAILDENPPQYYLLPIAGVMTIVTMSPFLFNRRDLILDKNWQLIII